MCIRDSYCFAKDRLDSDPKMFNCDMVLYYLQHYINGGKAPEQMIDPNTRTAVSYTHLHRFQCRGKCTTDL